MERSCKIKEVFEWVWKNLLHNVWRIFSLAHSVITCIGHAEKPRISPVWCWFRNSVFAKAMSLEHSVYVDIFCTVRSSGSVDHIIQPANKVVKLGAQRSCEHVVRIRLAAANVTAMLSLLIKEPGIAG